MNCIRNELWDEIKALGNPNKMEYKYSSKEEMKIELIKIKKDVKNDPIYKTATAYEKSRVEQVNVKVIEASHYGLVIEYNKSISSKTHKLSLTSLKLTIDEGIIYIKDITVFLIKFQKYYNDDQLNYLRSSLNFYRTYNMFLTLYSRGYKLETINKTEYNKDILLELLSEYNESASYHDNVAFNTANETKTIFQIIEILINPKYKAIIFGTYDFDVDVDVIESSSSSSSSRYVDEEDAEELRLEQLMNLDENTSDEEYDSRIQLHRYMTYYYNNINISDTISIPPVPRDLSFYNEQNVRLNRYNFVRHILDWYSFQDRLEVYDEQVHEHAFIQHIERSEMETIVILYEGTKLLFHERQNVSVQEIEINIFYLLEEKLSRRIFE